MLIDFATIPNGLSGGDLIRGMACLTLWCKYTPHLIKLIGLMFQGQAKVINIPNGYYLVNRAS